MVSSIRSSALEGTGSVDVVSSDPENGETGVREFAFVGNECFNLGTEISQSIGYLIPRFCTSVGIVRGKWFEIEGVLRPWGAEQSREMIDPDTSVTEHTGIVVVIVRG